ncbi:hypothetical protein KIL84_006028 [Mauremys mutica]|uniref:Uncharacterized protein n=1 Tax=Mauremys mutica TaxID=74926 RepID=A0A9D3XII8_9SAUR|nr:hypothetical protein KIL84_006028 [Mauremys mutica]
MIPGPFSSNVLLPLHCERESRLNSYKSKEKRNEAEIKENERTKSFLMARKLGGQLASSSSSSLCILLGFFIRFGEKVDAKKNVQFSEAGVQSQTPNVAFRTVFPLLPLESTVIGKVVVETDQHFDTSCFRGGENVEMFNVLIEIFCNFSCHNFFFVLEKLLLHIPIRDKSRCRNGPVQGKRCS